MAPRSLLNKDVDAGVVRVVRWQGARPEGRLGASRGSATPPACGYRGAGAARSFSRLLQGAAPLAAGSPEPFLLGRAGGLLGSAHYAGHVDDVTWGALTLTLTLLGGLYTWFAFRRRGFVAGLRGVGITLIPVALLLTDTLQMVTRIGSAVGDWVTDFAFSPTSWLGVILAGVSVVCFVVAGYLANRGVGGPAAGGEKAERPRELSKGKQGKPGPVVADVDPEMAEIEALLRKRGIT